MEDTSGPVIQAPFGEALISDWLAEGDRLSASAAEIPAPPPASESRLRHLLQRLQPVFARHRLFVLAGIGLLPVALIICTSRSAPAQAPAATVVLAPPATVVLAPPVAAFAATRPTAPAQTDTAPASAPAPVPTWVATAPLASAALAGPPAATYHHHHHHHHHHHAASAPGKAVASARPAPRR
jgi:hypothetical protein